MTFTAVVGIAILAWLNAFVLFFYERSKMLAKAQDDAQYQRDFYELEAFWRPFITNLSFGGISLAIALLATHLPPTRWDLLNPVLPLLVNLGMGLYAPSVLQGDYEPPSKKGIGVICIAILFYIYAGVVGMSLFSPIALLPNAPSQQSAVDGNGLNPTQIKP